MTHAFEANMSRWLGFGNTALLVTGVMLPVGGVISRLMAAGFVASFPNPLQLASTLPPGELASTGAMPVLTVAAFFGGAWLVARTLGRRNDIRAILSNTPVLFALAIAMGVGVLIIEAPWVGFGSAITSYVLFLVASWLGVREGHMGTGSSATRPVRGGLLAVTLFVMYGLAAAAYGFGGRLGPAGSIASTEQGITSGAYIRVAEDGDWLFLAPCSARGVVLQVPKSSVTSIRWQPGTIRSDLGETDVYRVCP